MACSILTSQAFFPLQLFYPEIRPCLIRRTMPLRSKLDKNAVNLTCFPSLLQTKTIKNDRKTLEKLAAEVKTWTLWEVYFKFAHEGSTLEKVELGAQLCCRWPISCVEAMDIIYTNLGAVCHLFFCLGKVLWQRNCGWWPSPHHCRNEEVTEGETRNQGIFMVYIPKN